MITFLNNINEMIFTMETVYVLFEIRIVCLIIFKTNLCFKGLNKYVPYVKKH